MQFLTEENDRAVAVEGVDRAGRRGAEERQAGRGEPRGRDDFGPHQGGDRSTVNMRETQHRQQQQG